MRTAFRTVGAVAPAIAARWAETLFCTPPARRDGDEAFIATGSRFSIASQGQQLIGWAWGSGPTVVLVHGWGSRASRLSALAAALVEAGFQVVAYDGPAHGESTGRSTTGTTPTSPSPTARRSWARGRAPGWSAPADWGTAPCCATRR